MSENEQETLEPQDQEPRDDELRLEREGEGIAEPEPGREGATDE